jgi:thiamine-phosphate pyrophosphorylase
LPVDFSLYLITDRSQCKSGDLVACVEEALEGGVGAVQLREKDLSTRERYDLAKKLRMVTSAAGAVLIINGDAALARAVGADGVHLPVDGLPIEVCRKVLEPGMLLGVSTHNLGQAREAEVKGADFITFGPVYFTSSKAKYGPPVGLEAFVSACRAVKLPVFGLGGISISNVEEVFYAGAAGVAVISAILAVPDIKKAASEFSFRLKQAEQKRVQSRVRTKG